MLIGHVVIRTNSKALSLKTEGVEVADVAGTGEVVPLISGGAPAEAFVTQEVHLCGGEETLSAVGGSVG